MICRQWSRFAVVGVSIPLMLASAALAGNWISEPTTNPVNAVEADLPAADQATASAGATSEEQLVPLEDGLPSIETVPELVTLLGRRKQVLLVVSAPNQPELDKLLKVISGYAPDYLALTTALVPIDSDLGKACGAVSSPTFVFWERGRLLGQLQNPTRGLLDTGLLMWQFLGPDRARDTLYEEQPEHNRRTQLQRLEASLVGRSAYVRPQAHVGTFSTWK